MKCRSCAKPLSLCCADLGTMPLANNFLKPEELAMPEVHYPLKVFVCDHCWLVQTMDFKRSDEIFRKDYAYFSSYSKTWLEHAQHFVAMISKRLELDANSKILEIASNDGYLLQYFVQKGWPCLGIEPTASTAAAARGKGIATIEEFWGTKTAQAVVSRHGKQDLVIANNVLAHVPDIHDFVLGIKNALADNGTATVEFQHVLNIFKHVQFDTIYHEHFSYLSLIAAETFLKDGGLKVYDVEQVPTHGGSLRLYIKHVTSEIPITPRVSAVREEEKQFGLTNVQVYSSFMKKVQKIKIEFLKFVLEQKELGKTIAAYGAAAKGNTFLNYCGIKGQDLIAFALDASPHKQGLFLPGSRLPIYGNEKVAHERVDWLLILPWNIVTEIMESQKKIREWGGRFVIAVPKLTVMEHSLCGK